VSRSQWIVGLGMGVAFILLAMAGSVLLVRLSNSRQPELGQRQPLPGLHYCSPDRQYPCVQSFHIDGRDRMVVEILTDPSLPAFDLLINHEDRPHNYLCVKTGGTSTRIACSGDVMPVGEALQFLLISRRDKRLLAEGQFAMIGLAIATPELASTPTPIPRWDHTPR
jgi:hypothetical protein